MKKVLVLKGNKKVLVKTVSTIKEVNAVVGSYNRQHYTVKVYSI